MLRVVVAVTVGGTTEVLVDGVMTHHEIQTDGPTSTLRVKGKDLTALMDYIQLDGLPYPAMPPAARVLLVLAKYAALGLHPACHSDHRRGHSDPDRSHPAPPGHRLRLREGAGRPRPVTSFYIDPGPVPGVSKAYWGPEIRVGVPQPALNAGLDGPHDNVTALDFTFDKEKKELPVVFIQEALSKAPIPIPIPDISPLNPPLGVVPPLPPKIKFLKDTAKLNPLGAALMRACRTRRGTPTSYSARAQLDVARYGHVLKSRAARRCARGRRRVQRSVLRDSGDPSDQAGCVHTDVRPGPQRAAVHGAGGAGMTTVDPQTNKVAYYGKYRGTCINNIDPMLQGRIQVIVPDVSTVAPTSWAMPCFPVTGIQNGVFTVPPIGAGVWVEFEQGDPDYPIWVGGYYAPADVPAAGPAGAAGPVRLHLPDDAAEQHHRSATRRDPRAAS